MKFALLIIASPTRLRFVPAMVSAPGIAVDTAALSYVGDVTPDIHRLQRIKRRSQKMRPTSLFTVVRRAGG